MDKKVFYSHGKLLITGEYLILDGAKGLALPTKFGQSLEVIKDDSRKIHWTGLDADGSIWYEDVFSFEDILNHNRCDKDTATRKTLMELLHLGAIKQPEFFSHDKGYQLTTRLTFPRMWGLGTSSTLVNNLAQWLQIDPYKLLEKTFGGSGYDIACAQHNHPIIYHLENEQPIVEEVPFQPVFSDKLYFVYLNQKQSSKAAIQTYMNQRGRIDKIIPKVNQLTEEMIKAVTLEDFSFLMLEHEALLSSVLEMKTVQEALFPDFKGTLKSLGAWGGDFILCANVEPPNEYFGEKGYHTIIPYNEMVLK